MNPTTRLKSLFIAAAVLVTGLYCALGAAEKTVLLRNGQVITVSGETITGGDILIQGTKIAKVGKSLAAPPAAEVIDLDGRWVMPGIIDSHSHIAVEGEVNESGNLLTPEVDVRDVINPRDMNIFYALTGGVTSIHTMHGSANPIGGRGIVLKLRWGKSAADLDLCRTRRSRANGPWAKTPSGATCRGWARPATPGRGWASRNPSGRSSRWPRIIRRNGPITRRKPRPPRKAKGRSLLPCLRRRTTGSRAVAEILSGKLWVRCHAYQSEEMLSIMRLCKEYGVKLVCFEHGLEGYRITNELVQHGVAISTFADFWAYKWEAYNTMPQAAALCAERGVLVALNSDDPERMRHLFNDAAKTVRFGGATEDEAIRMLTINPARILGVDKWVGTIEPGKDADLAVFSRHPLDPFTVCEMTMVDGTVVFDRAKYLAEQKKAEDGAKPKKEPEEKPGAPPDKGLGTISPFPPGPREPVPSVPPSAEPTGPPPLRGASGNTVPSPLSKAAAAGSGGLFIRNAKVVPVIGETMEGADIMIEGGKIKAVGKGLPQPADAEVIDASGMFVYPGFIDAYSRYGLAEIDSISSTTDFREMGRENPELRVAWAINPHSVHFGTGRVTGTTTALVAPAGGTFPGISALVKMDGWTLPEMAVKEAATSLINFPMTPRPPKEGAAAQKEAGEDVTSKLVEKISDYLKEARRYLELRNLAAADPGVKAPEHNPKYEALEPVLAGTLPVVISVEKAKDIELAIKFVREEKLKAIFRGCAQGFKVADKIKQSGIPVIIDSLYTGPSEPEDGYDAPYRNVVELAKAGVQFAFSSGGDPAQGKDLPYHAAKAVAFGLPREEAIRALTINPATILGVSDRLGSIEAGKDADLIIASGDPLDAKTEVKQLVINGRAIDMSNWWETLYDKFKKRPE